MHPSNRQRGQQSSCKVTRAVWLPEYEICGLGCLFGVASCIRAIGDMPAEGECDREPGVRHFGIESDELLAAESDDHDNVETVCALHVHLLFLQATHYVHGTMTLRYRNAVTLNYKTNPFASKPI
jgi:hypothetical protein